MILYLYMKDFDDPLSKEIVSTVSSKGQVTIPVQVRRHLGVDINDKVAFVIEKDGNVIMKHASYPDIASLLGAAGSLKDPVNWEIINKIRQEERNLLKKPPLSED